MPVVDWLAGGLLLAVGLRQLTKALESPSFKNRQN